MIKNEKKPVVIIIAGPTGIGKTDLSIRLAQHFDTEILSADSRQCFREMNIGTAKPSATALAQVKHHFINSHSVRENVTAFDFEQYGLAVLDAVFQKKNMAIVCGGTGLYIQALCHGLDEMPKVNEEIVLEIEKDYHAKGLKWLQNTVAQEDVLFFKSGEIQNPVRLMRALTFIRSTGKSIVDFRTGSAKERPFQTIKIALNLPRATIYQRINERVDKMMEAGLEAEVRSLLPFRHLKNLNTVGYSELFAFFDGAYRLEEAVEKIKQHSRNYAKRQLTWFRKDSAYQWFAPDDEAGILKYLQGAGVGEINL